MGDSIEKTSVRLDIDSPYIEPKGFLYRTKRRLTYAFAFRLLNKYLNRRQNLEILEIGTGSGFLSISHEKFLQIPVSVALNTMNGCWPRQLPEHRMQS